MTDPTTATEAPSPWRVSSERSRALIYEAVVGYIASRAARDLIGTARPALARDRLRRRGSLGAEDVEAIEWAIAWFVDATPDLAKATAAEALLAGRRAPLGPHA